MLRMVIRAKRSLKGGRDKLGLEKGARLGVQDGLLGVLLSGFIKRTSSTPPGHVLAVKGSDAGWR
jgi:hypothetical protein